MAGRAVPKTTFEPARAIEPIYTGGGVALSHEAQILATCLGEEAVISDISTGERLAKIEGDGEAITTLSLTPSASHLIISSRSLTLRIYTLRRVETQNVLAELVRTLKPHSSPVITAAVDGTGTILATGAADGIVKVWDIRGGFTTHTLHGHSGVVSALHFFETDAPTAKEEYKNLKKRKRKSEDIGDSEDAPNGESLKLYRLASGSEDGQIRIWDLKRRKCVAVLNDHVSVVRALDYSPEKELLLSASRDKTVILWDASSSTSTRTIPVLEGVEAAGFVNDGHLVFTGGERGKVRLWSADSGQEVTEEQTSGNEGETIVDIIQSRGGSYLVSIHADQTLLFHSLTSMQDYNSGQKGAALQIDRRISGTHDDIIDLAYVGGRSDFLAVATNLEELRILTVRENARNGAANGNAETHNQYFGADVGVLKGHEDIIICLDVDWSGHWIATGAKDNTARLWCVDPVKKSFSCFSTFTGHAGSLGAVALPKASPPETAAAYREPLHHPPAFLITGSQDKTVKKWDIVTGQKGSEKAARASYTRKAHDRDINALEVNHSSALFASASQDRTVKIWSLEEGEPVGILRGHKRGVWSVKFAPKEVPSITGETGQASSSRGLVLTGSGDKTVKMWSLADYSCLRTFEGHTNSVLKVLWMPTSSAASRPSDGEGAQGHETTKRDVLIASAGGDGLVKVWNVNTGELASTLDNHTDRVWAIATLPAAQGDADTSPYALVSGGGDSVITFWRDTSASTAAASAAASTARIEQDQQLQNYMRSGAYRQAITLALALDHPARLLSVFANATNAFPPETGSLTGVAAVDDVLAQLSDEQLWALLLRVRDWNTNAKTAPVAQKVLRALLKSYPASRFTKLRVKGNRSRKGSAETGVKEMLDALRVYTERHYRRMEDLIDESYLVDYTLREMDELGIAASEANGLVKAQTNGDDVIMTE